MMTPSTPREPNQLAENHQANQIQPSLRVLDEDFDDSRVIGKTLSELELDGELNWMGAYPIVEQRESVILPSGEYRFFNAPTQVVTGIVDANAPETFNSGQWRVVDDLYAEAIEDGDDDGETKRHASQHFFPAGASRKWQEAPGSWEQHEEHTCSCNGWTLVLTYDELDQ